MNKITSPESTKIENDDVAILEEYRHIRENAALKFVLYYRDTPDGKSYSIQSVKFVDGTKVCQATAADVSSNYSFAREMFERLADGEVEPVILHDVVYDLLP